MSYLSPHGMCLKRITVNSFQRSPWTMGQSKSPCSCLGMSTFCQNFQIEMSHWIRGSAVLYDEEEGTLWVEKANYAPENCFIQSPKPLSPDFQHFSVLVEEAGPRGEGPEVGVTCCSPHVFPPSVSLLKDYYTWRPCPDFPVLAGQRLGWGVHYSPALRHSATSTASSLPRRARLHGNQVDTQTQQLVLCYVTVDVLVVWAGVVLQPEGGFYPLVRLNQHGSRVVVDSQNYRQETLTSDLDRLYQQLLPPATQTLNAEKAAALLHVPQLRCSEALHVSAGVDAFTVTLLQQSTGVHVIQHREPLVDNIQLFVEITLLGERSLVCVGVTDDTVAMDTLPGLAPGSLGYYSLEGRLLHAGRCQGPALGNKYCEGDVVGVEYHVMPREGAESGEVCATLLFTCNRRPVGMRTVRGQRPLYATVGVAGNGAAVQLKLRPHSALAPPTKHSVTDCANWCLGDGLSVAENNDIVRTGYQQRKAALQASQPIGTEYQHVEVEILPDDDTSCRQAAPMLALLPASLSDVTITSQKLSAECGASLPSSSFNWEMHSLGDFFSSTEYRNDIQISKLGRSVYCLWKR